MPAIDDVPSLDEARAKIAARLEGLSLQPIALAVLDHVERIGDASFGVEDATEAAGLPRRSGEILAVMSHLTAGPRPALDLRVAFKDEAGTLHEVPSADLARVQEGRPYPHPVTGSLLDDPERSFYLRFSARPGLLPAPDLAP